MMGSEPWKSPVRGNTTGVSTSLLPQKTFSLRPLSPLPLQWSEWIFPLLVFWGFFPCLKGLRNPEVSQYFKTFVSGDTFAFFLFLGFSISPYCSWFFFWSSVTLKDASSNSKPYDMSPQISFSALRDCALYSWSTLKVTYLGAECFLKCQRYLLLRYDLNECVLHNCKLTLQDKGGTWQGWE